VGPAFEHAGDAIDFLAMKLQGGYKIEGEVAEFAWQCLEACTPVNINLAFECDLLAASLVPRDPKRALDLLKKLDVHDNLWVKGPWKTPLRGKVPRRDFPTALGNPASAAGFPLFPPPRRRGVNFTVSPRQEEE
jgi:hypothetical protein